MLEKIMIPDIKLTREMLRGDRPKRITRKSVMPMLNPKIRTKSSKGEKFLYILLAKIRKAPGTKSTKIIDKYNEICEKMKSNMDKIIFSFNYKFQISYAFWIFHLNILWQYFSIDSFQPHNFLLAVQISLSGSHP